MDGTTGSHALKGGGEECCRCRARPAAPAAFWWVRGHRLLSSFGADRGTMCWTCGRAAYRRCQRLTLFWGWLSLVGFWAPPLVAWRNDVHLRELAAGLNRQADGVVRPPTPAHDRRSRRWRALGVLGLVLALAAAVVGLTIPVATARDDCGTPFLGGGPRAELRRVEEMVDIGGAAASAGLLSDAAVDRAADRRSRLQSRVDACRDAKRPLAGICGVAVQIGLLVAVASRALPILLGHNADMLEERIPPEARGSGVLQGRT